MFTPHLFFKFFLFVLMTLIASIITFSNKKKMEKNVTLDPRLGTLALDMELSTLDPRQKDRLHNYMPENFLEINRYFALTSYCKTIGQSNNASSILGFSLARKRRVHALIFPSTGW